MGKPPMIRADMIPPEVVEALAVAWRDEMNSAHALAAALNAWPGWQHRIHIEQAIILPLPQEVSDE